MGICPMLHEMVLPLQQGLRQEGLPEVHELHNIVKVVWKYVVSANLELALVRDVSPSHLMVDWISLSAVYASFCGHPSQGLLIGLNSHKLMDDFSSSLGELKTVV